MTKISGILVATTLLTVCWSLPARLGGQSPDSDFAITVTEGTGMAAVASPDRRSIAIDLLGALWVIPIGGGTARRVTPDTIEARRPSWSPDSRSLAFQGFGDAWHIYTIAVEGTALEAVTSGPFDDREPDWSRDGKRIAFTSDRVDGIRSLWQVDLETRTIRQLSAHAASDPCWTASDREVAFLGRDPQERDSRPELWLASPDGAEQRLPVLQIAGGGQPKLPMPCGSGRTFWPPAGPGLLLAPDEDVFSTAPPQWLSASEFLYTADGHIKRRTDRGRSATVVPFSATLTLHRPRFQPTRRDLEPETPQSVLGIVNPVVSPDGSQVAFVALGDLWVVSIGQGPTAVTNDVFVELDPAWSPDGARLAFASDRGGHMDLWVHDFRTNLETQLTAEREHGTVSAPAWSPDGRSIAYLVNGRSLRVAQADTDVGRVSRALVQGPTDLGRPTWPPDGLRIGVGDLFRYASPFAGGTNQMMLHALTGESPTAVMLTLHQSAGNRVNNGPIWSADGRRMAYVTEGKLWVVDVGSDGAPQGDRRAITDDLPDSPSWQADSQHIVYLTTNGLRRVSVDDGRMDERDFALTLGWQPLLPDRLVVHAGSVFDGRSQQLWRDVDIVIERARIRSVEPHRDELHEGNVIDASEETVMPGLIDMHARLDGGYGDALGRLLLSYGITSVRDPESTAFASLERRESYEAGRRPGPRVFVAGDPLTGARVFEAGEAPVTSERQLQLEIERRIRLGLDFFATSGRLPDRYLRRLTEYAHAQGVPVSTHDIFPAAAADVDGIEGLARRGRNYLPDLVSGRSLSYRDVIDVVAKSGITLTPLISAAGFGADGGFAVKAARNRSLLDDPRLGLLPPSRLEEFSAQAMFMRERPIDAARVEATVAALRRTVFRIVAAGGRIVSGSAAPEVPYGVGLHVELEQLVDGGLSPFQALQTATINAADALGAGDVLGTIEAGKLADLVFVGGEPLRDIRNARDVHGVIRGGRYYDLATLLN